MHNKFLGIVHIIIKQLNVRATMLTPRSVEVTWTVSSSPDVTGYIISYITTAEYIDVSNRSGSVIVSSSSTISHTLNNLEEGTLYTISVRATTNVGRMSGNIVVSSISNNIYRW